MTEILFESEQNLIPVTDELTDMIKSVCDTALSLECCDFDAQISVTLTDAEAVHRLNAEHRGIDRTTDVLSFPMLEFDENGEADASDAEYDGDFLILGDIVINAAQAISQAEAYGHGVKRELAFLTAHSMLHLLGYDHELSEEDDAIMRKKQNEILNILNITR